ncbi:hypothetical protein ACH5A7_20940 [Streptomyces sp. NPDC018955]|uniref:hypothetical protein n=1 Tax=Streptomyces sp. NPDC018955 TaxID=3365055 RepID=UPI0037A523D6
MSQSTSTTQQPPSPTARPDGVIAQYPTPAGATVHVTDLGPDTHWRYTSQCTGCPHKDGYRNADTARSYARTHAKKCYEPAVTA